MATKTMFFSLFALALVAICSAGIAPAAVVAPAAYVAPYASTYNAHVVNHAIAAPVAPLVAAHSAPLVAAAAYPYAYPYNAYPYAAPYVVAK